MNNKSPLRYPGGKTRACKKLDQILNEYFDITKITTIISPFFGGGSFEFFLQNKYNYRITANDKFQPLFSFWDSCKCNNAELCKNLNDNFNIDKDIFGRFRGEIMDEKNRLRQAMLYFIINRCSFSGSTLSGGFSAESARKRYTKSSIERVAKLDLSQFTIVNMDFKVFLQNGCRYDQNSLIFLDPPYYLGKQSRLYGKNGDMHENFDHDGLYDIISKKRGWILTYNNCDWIKDKYKEFTILDDVSWSYGMNKSKESSELVILG